MLLWHRSDLRGMMRGCLSPRGRELLIRRQPTIITRFGIEVDPSAIGVLRHALVCRMTESDFFNLLRGRVSRELAGMRERKLRSWWCDGFTPEKFVVTGNGSHVSGRVWMDPGDGNQAPWNFVLLLGPRRLDRTDVPWAESLPVEGETGWLSLDFGRRFMKIKLSAAYPDHAAAT